MAVATVGGEELPQPYVCEDLDAVHLEVQRLLVDVGHHAQRLHDLAYDEVELELGGSE